MTARPAHGSPFDVPAPRFEIEEIRAAIVEAERTWARTARYPDEARRLEESLLERRVAAAYLQFRVDAAERRHRELQADMAALRAEIAGLERGLVAVLRAVLEEVGDWSAPFWTPLPVLGYRVWELGRDGLRGATGTTWTAPVLTARCGPHGRPDDPEVPHVDGRCGSPPCGIYALKEPRTLLRFRLWQPESPGLGVVIGLAALSGRVVEHDHGYRAAQARVAAVAVVLRTGMLLSSDPVWIGRLFADPRGTVVAGVTAGSVHRLPTTGDPGPAIIEFFTNAEREERTRWTSESPSGSSR